MVEDSERRAFEELLRRMLKDGAQGQNIEIGDLRTTETDILAGELLEERPPLHSVRRTIRLRDGVFERNTQGLKYVASCGHLIHSAEEVGGRCQFNNCGSIVCIACIRNCQRCGKALCKKHQRIDGDAVYCPRCKEWVDSIKAIKRLLGFKR